MDSCHVTDVASLNLALLFATGLTISVGHCVGMCGPIQTAFSLGQQRRGTTGLRFLPALLRYHLGRVLGYVAIGVVFGTVGSAAGAGGIADSVQAWFALAAASLILASAAAVLGFPLVSGSSLATVGAPVGRTIQRFLAAPSWSGQLSLGIANGFLPCGPVLGVALAAAATGNPARGALVMAAYGLGTVPALVTLALLSHRVAGLTRRRFVVAGAILMSLVGAQLLLRGLSALGTVPHAHIGEFVLW